VNFLGVNLIYYAPASNFLKGAYNTLYFQIQIPEEEVQEELNIASRLLQTKKKEPPTKPANLTATVVNATSEEAAESNSTDTEGDLYSGTLYEGVMVSIKLLAPSDEAPTFVLINDMYGDYKVSKLDNKFFAKININQSKKNNEDSVWKLADESFQTYIAQETGSEDMRSVLNIVMWRLCNNERNFKVARSTEYSWHGGYRYYKVGTNTNSGVATLMGDSEDFTFNFEAAITLGCTFSLLFAIIL
jgi:hypothetical protein